MDTYHRQEGGHAGVEPDSWLKMDIESPGGACFSKGVSVESGLRWGEIKGERSKSHKRRNK